MKTFIPHVLLACAVVAPSSLCWAQTYKCITANGSAVISDTPCSNGARAQRVVRETNPVGNEYSAPGIAASRDEAALDAKVAEALGMGDFPRAKGLAVTTRHWQMIAEAEQRRQAQVVGRTAADVRAEARNSRECKDAQRSYDNEASSIRQNRNQIDAAKRNMYSACGMDAPTEINIRNSAPQRPCVGPNDFNCVKQW